MFKKKPNVKALAPLRSSDRRKLADQIIKDFGIEIPKHEEQANGDKTLEQSEGALTLTSLRSSLLPENALSARFTTTAGPNLKQVSGTIYAGATEGEEQRILWFKVEERLIPTVYTLWKNAHLCPLLHTPGFVVEKLQAGAPLMTPGLAGGPPFPPRATKGAVVAVASIERPTVPIAVGVCEIDVASLGSVQGTKGHAVRTEHWQGDELWAWSTTGIPGAPAPDQVEGWGIENGANCLESPTEKLVIADEDDEINEGGVALPSQEPSKKHNEHVEGENMDPWEKVEEKEMSTKDIDNVFWQAFIYGVFDAKRKNKEDPNHGLSFPIPQSLVLSNLILPYLPIHTPAQAAALNMKKTSWKNLKKFIKALDKAKLIKCKERDGGECVVLDVDFTDQTITTFTPYKLPKKETPGADSGGGGGGKAIVSGINPSDSAIGQRLQKINLYRPKESLSPIFDAANASTRSLYLPPELRQIITTYIEAESLISSTNKRLITLNPILANAVFDGSSSLDREVLAKGTVPRDALIDRLREACSPFWAILRNDESRETVKAKSGHAPKVQIVLETRSGNKTVTKVSGVETFYVNVQPLAEELQKSCASSTSVSQLVGSSPKNPVMEVLVQGPKREEVMKALEKRGVERGWIEVVDKTKGKKKR